MKDELVRLTYEIELQPGEQLSLPEALVAGIGPGRWRLTIQPAIVFNHLQVVKESP